MRINKIFLEEVHSTNTWLLDALNCSTMAELPEGTIAYSFRQTAGRGQVGNKWESEPDKNVSFSMLLRPEFLPVNHQFAISELCSLGIVMGLEKLGLSRLSIKWPNDVYVGDEKICGILIENRLRGSVLAESVLGVGINVGQVIWKSEAPNPTSFALQGLSVTPDIVLDVVVRHIASLYDLFCEGDSGALVVHKMFVERLYRRTGLYPYVDAQTGEAFVAELANVDRRGPLILRLPDGSERRYWFKEVRFVLPCGIVKE